MAGTHTSGRLLQPVLLLVAVGSSPASPRVVSSITRVKQSYEGRGRIRATTKIKGTPNRPDYSRVILIQERGHVVIREVWSDPVTGAFEFSGIDETQTYTVVTYDETHNFRAVVADNITPDPMP